MGLLSAAIPALGLATVLYMVYRLFRLRSTSDSNKPMQISEIYVYPIKSLRPTKLTSAIATRSGFKYDRTFMLLKRTPDGYKNMAVSNEPEMTQFLTNIDRQEDQKGRIEVTFAAFGEKEKMKTLSIPLVPDTEKLESFEVHMHGSSTAAFKMPQEYNSWFTGCFGYEVILVYLGNNRRGVLFPDVAHAKNSSLLSWIPFLGDAVAQGPRITFADCAPYLMISSKSLDEVSSRLGPGEKMDVTKFRPNIVVSGAAEAWEEDYWHKAKIGRTELVMKHNCVRCVSINIDYNTGEFSKGISGQALKSMQKDRRVDKGNKWSPVFGRYTFWNGKHDEQIFQVGDEVVVTHLNKERTVFNWPGL